MSKKQPFLKKGEGQRFELMHRSLNDAGNGCEDAPSPFVLVPVESGNVLKRNERIRDSASQAGGGSRSETASQMSRVSTVSKSSRVSKDHINAMGFKNDGYDYDQHFRAYSGGKFMTKDGKMTTINVPDVEVEDDERSLIEKSLPSELFATRELEVEAITISADVMDKDIHDGLFDDNDSNDFEQMDDDFVAKAIKGEGEADPDFDAHLQELLYESEKQTFGYGARGRRVAFGKINEDEEYYDDEEGYEDGDYDYNSQDEIYSDEYGDEYDDDDHAGKEEFNYDGFDVPVTEEQKVFDSKFEKALEEEYGEDDIGGLDDESIEGGSIDLENEELDKAMDEFIFQHESEYNAVINKANLGKLESHHSSIVAKSKIKKEIFKDRRGWDVEDETHKELLKDKDYLQTQVSEALNAQDEAVELIKRIEIDEKSGVIGEEMMKALPYVAKQKVIEEWDCESILSTYSTTENHPTVIRSSSSKFKEHKSKFVLADERAYEQRQKTMENTENLLKLNRSRILENSTGPVPQIVLGGKLGLPRGFESSYIGKPAGDNNDSEDDSSDDGDQEKSKVDTSIGRPKNETKEEKAARKKAAKDDKREKRALKKATKTVYSEESKKLAGQNTNTADVSGVPVFRYT